MMTAPCSSGHCAMHADRPNHLLRALSLALLMMLTAGQLWAAEAPLPDLLAAESVLPLPPEAEAAHQDLRGREGASHSVAGKTLDEAIFTEISPLTIPEIGIALPADQDH